MLLFIDSGDHHAAAVSSGKWDLGVDFDPTSQAGNGRFGTNPVMYGFSARSLGKNLGANYSELIIGGATRFAGDGNFSNHNIPFFSFWDSSSCQMEIRYDVGDSVFRIYRGFAGSGGALLDLIPYTFLTSSFVYSEFRCLFHNSAGAYEFRIDGVPITSWSGIDTTTTANNYANIVFLGERPNNAAHAVYYDDVYILETGSGENTDFLGDVRVEPLFPSGNGNSSQFIGSDSNSTDNYLLVDEVTPNGDTDYVQSGSVGDKDTYAYTDVSAVSGTVFGVQPLISAKKTDAGARSIASIARLSTTEVDSADESLSTSYLYKRDIRELDPNGTQWTITSVNAAEFGVKVTV